MISYLTPLEPGQKQLVYAAAPPGNVQSPRGRDGGARPWQPRVETSVGEWTHTTCPHPSATSRSEALTPAAPWTHPEHTTLREGTRHERAHGV